MPPADSIEMNVGGLTLDPSTRSPIVVLKDSGNTVNLPIWIGLLEATAIATEIEGVEMARPMTHDLLSKMIDELGGEVVHVEISDLRENTYYARIQIRTNGESRTIDSRPSDAISLALRVKSPIYVARKVLEASESAVQVVDEEGAGEPDLSTVSREKWSEILEKMSPDDFKYKM